MSYSVVPLDTCNVNPYDRGWPVLGTNGTAELFADPLSPKTSPSVRRGTPQDDRLDRGIASARLRGLMATETAVHLARHELPC